MCVRRGQRSVPAKRVNSGAQPAAQAQAQAQADQLLGTQRIDLMSPQAPSAAAAPNPAASWPSSNSGSGPGSGASSSGGSELAVVRGGGGVELGEEPGAPTLNEPLLNFTRRVGATVRITCEITGNPRPRYTWKKDGRPISASDPKYTMTDLAYGHRCARFECKVLYCTVFVRVHGIISQAV